MEELVALYCAADVMLVTPLRDGMNLVAKEYVASRVDQRRRARCCPSSPAPPVSSAAADLVNPHDIEDMKVAITRGRCAVADPDGQALDGCSAVVRPRCGLIDVFINVLQMAGH